MRRAAEILRRLYASGKVQKEGLRRAVIDGVISEEEYVEITGGAYSIWD